MSVLLFSLGTVLFYVTGSVLQWVRISGKKIPGACVSGSVVLGLILHAMCLKIHILTSKGVLLNIFTVGSLCCWVAILIVLLGNLRKPLANIFAISLPFVSLVVLCAWIFTGPDDLVARLSPGIVFHIIVSVLAYSTFSIATIQACFLGFQEYRIKHHAPHLLLHIFPPLETMERLLFDFILAGMVLLTLSLVSGFVYFQDLIVHHLSHETMLALTSWVIFGTLLLGRFFQGWRGQRAIRWTLCGFILLMLAYFGSKLLSDMWWS